MPLPIARIVSEAEERKSNEYAYMRVRIRSMWILIVFSHCVCALGDALDTISPRRSESDFLNKSTILKVSTRFGFLF